MKVLIFGASGMVGQGVLRECLQDPQVDAVLSVVRQETGQKHSKLRELLHSNFYDFSTVERDLSGWDACFFCLGVSSMGMTEEKYRHITLDITLAAAGTLVKLNPGMTFIYVSGMHTDSSEQGSRMWARVKGQTENALLKVGFKAAYMFRPGLIVPLHGVQSKTVVYRIPYLILKPFLPLLLRWFPRYVLTTEQVGQAMLNVTRRGNAQPLLETVDIHRLSV
jgi:uncharacterized protein YbjT (DUF2867 family)